MNLPSRSAARAALRCGLLLPVLALLVGCGGTGTVSGTVSYKPKNKNLVAGTVMVMTQDGAAFYGDINHDGTYRVEGVPTGPTKVTISSPDPKANPNAGAGHGAPKGAAGKPTRTGAAGASAPPLDPNLLKDWFPIPAKYGDATASGLTFDVKKGDNTFNIALD